MDLRRLFRSQEDHFVEVCLSSPSAVVEAPRGRSVRCQLYGLFPLLAMMLFPVLLRLVCAFDDSHSVTEAQGGGEEQVEIEHGSQGGPDDGPYPEDL